MPKQSWLTRSRLTRVIVVHLTLNSFSTRRGAQSSSRMIGSHFDIVMGPQTVTMSYIVPSSRKCVTRLNLDRLQWCCHTYVASLRGRGVEESAVTTGTIR